MIIRSNHPASSEISSLPGESEAGAAGIGRVTILSSYFKGMIAVIPRDSWGETFSLWESLYFNHQSPHCGDRKQRFCNWAIPSNSERKHSCFYPLIPGPKDHILVVHHPIGPHPEWARGSHGIISRSFSPLIRVAASGGSKAYYEFHRYEPLVCVLF